MSGREKPILFNGEMIRAHLAGRKTQTRRLVVPQPDRIVPRPRAEFPVLSLGRPLPEWDRPPRVVYEVGDRLWVRETWRIVDPAEADIMFAADEMQMRCLSSPDGWWRGKRSDQKWRPSIHMPRWASRITLEVTGVRVERLQDISEEDARAEGVEVLVDGIIEPGSVPPRRRELTHRDYFRDLWDSINAKRAPWGSNPWVWVISFRRVLKL